jgi:hypothetical protein
LRRREVGEEEKRVDWDLFFERVTDESELLQEDICLRSIAARDDRCGGGRGRDFQ